MEIGREEADANGALVLVGTLVMFVQEMVTFTVCKTLVVLR